MIETLKQYAEANLEESDHFTLVCWLSDISEAIDDGEEVSEANREAWNSKPAVWEKTSFRSGVVISENPIGHDVWGHVDLDHLRLEMHHAKIAEKEYSDWVEFSKANPRNGVLNRGVSYR